MGSLHKDCAHIAAILTQVCILISYKPLCIFLPLYLGLLEVSFLSFSNTVEGTEVISGLGSTGGDNLTNLTKSCLTSDKGAGGSNISKVSPVDVVGLISADFNLLSDKFVTEIQ